MRVRIGTAGWSIASRYAEAFPRDGQASLCRPFRRRRDQQLILPGASPGDLIATWLEEISGLGEKLAVLLVQLPPQLAFDASVAEPFFAMLTSATPARATCEPRRPSWFELVPDALLGRLKVARVAADPARVPVAARPGGWRGFAYWRLHGSPLSYRSAYDSIRLDDYADAIRNETPAAGEAWCIFDNTAAMAAVGNAFALAERLSAHPTSPFQMA